MLPKILAHLNGVYVLSSLLPSFGPQIYRASVGFVADYFEVVEVGRC